jgi:hypothetical protein
LENTGIKAYRIRMDPKSKESVLGFRTFSRKGQMEAQGKRLYKQEDRD